MGFRGRGRTMWSAAASETSAEVDAMAIPAEYDLPSSCLGILCYVARRQFVFTTPDANGRRVSQVREEDAQQGLFCANRYSTVDAV
jgi:hypothetical protein